MEKSSSYTGPGLRKDFFFSGNRRILKYLLFFLFLACNTVYAPPCWSNEAGYSILVASYQSPHMVTTEVNRLKEQNYPVYYRESTQGKKKTFRVFVGPYPTMQRANAEAAKLKRAGLISSTQIVSGTASASKPTETAKPAPATAKPMETAKTAPVVSKPTETAKPAPETFKPTETAKPTEAVKPAPVVSQPTEAAKPAPAISQPTETAKPTPVVPKQVGTAKPAPAISKPTETVQPTPAVPKPVETAKPAPAISKPTEGEKKTALRPETPAAASDAQTLSRWPYFDNAMRDFQDGQYKKALPVFQSILAQKETGKPWHELAERRIADCLYFLNTGPDAGHLYNLVNQYNSLLLKYPDVRPENDIIYWRLGHLYRMLRNYSQADNAYKKLLLHYPNSPFAEESHYQTGDILRIDKQYAAATAVLKAFYAKYPNSPLARSAIFSIADSYYNMGLTKEADQWYNNALQRWPDLYGLPEDVFLNAGYHFYSTGDYAKAFRILSYFRNLYPQSRFMPSVTRIIAQCLVKMNQTAAAIRLLGTALDKEKDIKESIRIRMMLAEMGITNPKARTSLSFSGTEIYRNPARGFAEMIADLKGDPLTEEVLYQKGRLLETANRPQEAFDAYSELLQRYPGSRHLQTAQASVKRMKTDLINNNYQKQDYLAVANLYFSEKDPQYPWSGDILYKIADSFKNLGLYEQAARLFSDMQTRKLHPDSRIPELAIAWMDVDSGNYRAAQRRLIPLVTKKPAPDAVEREIRRLLADSYYFAGGAFDKAAELYAAAMPFDKGDTLAMQRYVNALKRTNQTTLALQHSQNILNDAEAISAKEGSSLGDRIYLDRAELYSRSGQPEKSVNLLNRAIPSLENDFDKRWAEFILTNNYVEMNNPDLATEAANRLRQNTNDPFWQRIADYGLNDSLWFNTNKNYLE